MPCQDALPCAFEAVLDSNLFVTLPALIEKYPLGRVAEAYEQMYSGWVRFRVVLTFDGVPAVWEQ